MFDLDERVQLNKTKEYGKIKNVLEDNRFQIEMDGFMGNVITPEHEISKVIIEHLESIDKWQEKWKKEFEQNRMRWLTEMNPKAINFLKGIELLSAEYSDGYILHFRTLNRKHSLEIKEYYPKQTAIRIYRGEEYTLLQKADRGHNDILEVLKNPFGENEAKIILDFLVKKKERIKEAVTEIQTERRRIEYTKFKDEFIGLTIVEIDDKKNEFILSDGKRISSWGLFSQFQEEEAKKRLGY